MASCCRRYRARRLKALAHDPQLLVIRPAPPATSLDHLKPFKLSTALMAVHKDCYAPIGLIQQGGPRRRETRLLTGLDTFRKARRDATRASSHSPRATKTILCSLDPLYGNSGDIFCDPNGERFCLENWRAGFPRSLPVRQNSRQPISRRTWARRSRRYSRAKLAILNT